MNRHHSVLGTSPAIEVRRDATLGKEAGLWGGVVSMVQEKYGVRLTAQDKGRLRRMIRAGRNPTEAITQARILLKTDEGWTAARMAAAMDV